MLKLDATLPERLEQEAQTLAHLTGWDIQEIRTAMGSPEAPAVQASWWERLWSE